MTTQWHFEQDPFGRSLKIYAFDPDRRLQFSIMSADSGIVQIRQDELPEGVAPEPFLEMAWVFADGFIDGFKKFLGEQNNLPADAIPRAIYEREAGRVDRLIEFAISPPPFPQVRLADG